MNQKYNDNNVTIDKDFIYTELKKRIKHRAYALRVDNKPIKLHHFAHHKSARIYY